MKFSITLLLLTLVLAASSSLAAHATTCSNATIRIAHHRNPNLPDLHAQFIVSDSGDKIRQVVTDPGLATMAEGERLHTSRP